MFKGDIMNRAACGSVTTKFIKSVSFSILLVGFVDLAIKPDRLDVFQVDLFALTLIFFIFLFNVGSVRGEFSFSFFDKSGSAFWFFLLIPTLICNGLVLFFLFLDIGMPSSVDQSRGNIFKLIVSAVILTPLMEELIFRHIVPCILHNHLKIHHWLVVAISSALFSASHLSFDIAWFTYFFVMGLSFHFVRDITGSLALAFMSHAILNLSIIALDMLLFD